MGYSNKRRRSKRRRTRILNAMQNHPNLIQNLSWDEDSSIEYPEQSSTFTGFCSTHSHHSSVSSDTTPMTPHNNILTDTISGDIQTDQDSVLDIVNVHEILNHTDTTENIFSNPEDDGSAQSTFSCPDNNQSQANSFECYQHHCFDQMTHEIASYQIMSLLDSAGAPRICYNRLIALLKKLSKLNGFDVKRAINRETLMTRLGLMYPTPPRIQSSIINKQEVFRFSFQDMLQDLIHGAGKHIHQICPKVEGASPETGMEHELWNTQWMNKTFATQQYSDFNPEKDLMLPIIIYLDKTGTDVNQRYSLEPVLFSVAAIPWEQRESRHSWRHLGFVPQRQKCTEEETSSHLQFYHDCLYYLLDGLRKAQESPPTVLVRLEKDHSIVERRALLPLMVVMGDQLSQDTLCGRLKANSGGAGRVHRSCMCSYLNVDDPYHDCKTVKIDTLNSLTRYAMISDQEIARTIASHPTVASSPQDSRTLKSYLHKQRAMFRSILRHPFTAHPINNAFNGINFGSWSNGIHEATVDDFMHSVEAGMIAYITETVYDGLTKKEKETVEEFTRHKLDNQRCSVIAHYPRWRLQPGFTRQTLMTSGERVGSVLALSLSLQDPTIRETICSAHCRQTEKYTDLSPQTDALTSPPEFYLNQHMHDLDEQSIQHTLEHMVRHSFPLDLLDDLDPFQINQMIWHCSDLFKNTHYPNNYLHHKQVPHVYTDLGNRLIIPMDRLRAVKFAFQTKPSKLLKNYRYRKVEGTTAKHHLKKVSKKGEGSSAAVLTNNMLSLTIFLEYVLCYHAFCKYSWSLPVFLQQNYKNIKNGNCFVVEYFQKFFYRGNSTIDSRFPKLHSQCRMGKHTEDMNSVMNFCCETGERLLKTEAKGISRTAQQRGETFLTQTMSRLQDRVMLDSLALYLDEKQKSGVPTLSEQRDHFGRTHPHFIYHPETEQVHSLNRKNELMEPHKNSGTLTKEITVALKMHEPNMKKFEVYNEVVLRDNSRLRASPNYANFGPWYDYVNVSWEKWVHGSPETYLLPARCLCFFGNLVAHYCFRRNHFFSVIKTEFVITPESHPNSGNDPVFLSK